MGIFEVFCFQYQPLIAVLQHSFSNHFSGLFNTSVSFCIFEILRIFTIPAALCVLCSIKLKASLFENSVLFSCMTSVAIYGVVGRPGILGLGITNQSG